MIKQERGISFEQIVLAIENNQIVDVIEHPNQVKYKEQKFIMVESNNYVFNQKRSGRYQIKSSGRRNPISNINCQHNS